MSDNAPSPFAAWAILELMGHRRLAGYLSEQELAGHGFIRLDIPAPVPATQLADFDATAGPFKATQFYAPGAVYAITPCSEAIARRIAAGQDFAPVQTWELPLPTPERIMPPADMGNRPFCPDCGHSFELHAEGGCEACQCELTPRPAAPRGCPTCDHNSQFHGETGCSMCGCAMIPPGVSGDAEGLWTVSGRYSPPAELPFTDAHDRAAGDVDPDDIPF